MYYFVTFTTSGGLTPDHCSDIKRHFMSTYDECIGSIEQHASGGDHIHITYHSKSKTSGCLTRVFERMYDRCKIPFTKGVSIDNKRVTSLIGSFHYVLEHVHSEQELWMLKAWKWTWIQQQCLDNIHLIPRKMLSKGYHVVTQFTCCPLMIEYAKATGREIDSNDLFCQVYAEMKSKKYQFDKIKIGPVYTQVMALNGKLYPAYNEARQATQYLDS